MNPCSNSISITAPTKDIQYLLSDGKIHLLEIIKPHTEDELNDFLSVEEDIEFSTLEIRNLDTYNPPIETVEMLGNSLLQSKVRLEYLNADDWYVGIIEMENCQIIQKEHYHYKWSKDLQEFANRTGHLEADVFAFGMKDMACYQENEQEHSNLK